MQKENNYHLKIFKKKIIKIKLTHVQKCEPEKKKEKSY